MEAPAGGGGVTNSGAIGPGKGERGGGISCSYAGVSWPPSRLSPQYLRYYFVFRTKI